MQRGFDFRDPVGRFFSLAHDEYARNNQGGGSRTPTGSADTDSPDPMRHSSAGWGPYSSGWGAHGTPRLVVLTAALTEYKAVREFLTGSHTRQSVSGAPYTLGGLAVSDGMWEVWATCIGQGNIAAALQTSRAVLELRPSLIAFVGTAGSLKSDVRLGDVVFATKVYGYESARQTDEGLLGRPVIEVADRTLTEHAFRVAAEDRWHRRIPRGELEPPPAAHVAPIAAGDKLHAGNRSALHTYLRTTFDDAHAVEMEGLGFLSGARFWPTDTRAVLVRGVSDRLVDKEPGQDARMQPAACRNAMAFLRELLEGCRPPYDSTAGRAHPAGLPRHRRRGDPPTFIPLASDGGVSFLRRDDIPALDLVGQVVDRRYRLVREIGCGALNVVWEAEEFAFGGSLGRVALKLQPPQGDKRFVYFSREAMVMAGLNSPTVLPYRSAGTQQGGLLDGWSFICTALAEFSLRDAVSERPLWGKDLLEMLRDVAEGLCHLHAQRLVHGDVKPANILRLGQRWVIGDFGLTQRTGASEPEGTVGYMAPERFDGMVTSKNDVYSLAVTAAVAASGRVRNESSTVEGTYDRVMDLLARDIPAPPPLRGDRFPPVLEDALRQALLKDPGVRPTMEEILGLLCTIDTTARMSIPRTSARHARR